MKKGIVNHFVSILIAIIGIALLVIAGAKLYNFFADNETKNAQSFIDGLVGKIELLEDGERNTFLLRGVGGWYLKAYNEEGKIGIDRPEKCSFGNCICISPEPTVESCQNEGIHRMMDRTVTILSETKSEILPGKDRVVAGYWCMTLTNKLNEISIEITKDDILITTDISEKVSTFASALTRCGQKINFN
jgi:hypothetical protein